MAQNYRNQSGRPDYGRGGRHQTGSERVRYRTGGEHRFNPDWNERDDRAFEGDRSYSAGGYSEEFGFRRGRNRDASDRDYRSENHQSRGASGASYQSSRDYGRYDEGRFDEGNRWSEGARSQGDDDYEGSEFYDRGRRAGTSSWPEDLGGESYYGSQSSYGRDYGGMQRERQRPWSGYDYGSSSRSQSQSFRGRGPQGYQRSDDRLKELVCERLTDDPNIDASNITVEVTSQVVKLTGTVDDRSTKYEIEELIEGFGGVKDIDNQLRVRQQPSSYAQAGQQLRSGSDWESGSSNLASSGRTSSAQSSGATPGTTNPSKRN